MGYQGVEGTTESVAARAALDVHLAEAEAVQLVTTLHGHALACGRVQLLVAVLAQYDLLLGVSMVVAHLLAHTGATGLTVKEILSATCLADTAAIAMELALGQIVVEEIAHGAEVRAECGAAAFACRRRRLLVRAPVAHHLRHGETVHLVRVAVVGRVGVVAKTAGEVSVAARREHPAAPVVVLAATSRRRCPHRRCSRGASRSGSLCPQVGAHTGLNGGGGGPSPRRVAFPGVIRRRVRRRGRGA